MPATSMHNSARLLVILGPIGLLTWGGYLLWSANQPTAETFVEAVDAVDRGDFPAVERTMSKLSRQSEFVHHLDVLQGGLLLRSGQFDRAAKQLAQVPLAEPYEKVALRWMGESLIHLGRLAEAERCLRRVVESEADNTQAHRWLASVYYDLGAMDLAISESKEVIRLEPNDFRAYQLLGDLYFDFERYSEAIEHYVTALTLRLPDENRKSIVEHLAEAQFKQRDYSGALETLKFSGDDANLLALQAECQLALGNADRARELLIRAQELDPRSRRVLLLTAQLASDAGEYEHAVAPLRRHLEDAPHDYEVRYQLALAYRFLGRTDDSQSEMQMMERSRDMRNQLSALNREAIRQPRSAQIRYEAAKMCTELGLEDQARMWLRAAEACSSIARPAEMLESTGDRQSHTSATE